MEDETRDEPEIDHQSKSQGRRDRQRLIVLAAVLVVAVAIFGAMALSGDDEADDELPGVPTQVAGLAQNIPAPASCQIAPRAVAEMQSLVATPAASPTAEVAVATPDPAEGTPANAATVEAIVAAYTESIACQNAGSFARTYALYTDDFVRRILGGASAQLGVDPALVAVVVGTPTTVPPMEWTAIVARGAVQLLPDGRASAVFVTVTVREAGSSDATRPRVVLFVQEDGRWLIDGTVDPSMEAMPEASPPA
ncbi:MAG: hypothetical protein ACRDJW_14140 [Thermomicrobiales bacterium]